MYTYKPAIPPKWGPAGKPVLLPAPLVTENEGAVVALALPYTDGVGHTLTDVESRLVPERYATAAAESWFVAMNTANMVVLGQNQGYMRYGAPFEGKAWQAANAFLPGPNIPGGGQPKPVRTSVLLNNFENWLAKFQQHLAGAP